MSLFFMFEGKPHPSPAHTTPPVLSVVLLHTEANGKRLFRGSAYFFKFMFFTSNLIIPEAYFAILSTFF